MRVTEYFAAGPADAETTAMAVRAMVIAVAIVNLVFMSSLLRAWGRDGSAALARSSTQLVEVDSTDEDDPDGDVLPIRVHADDDEAARERRRNEDADDGAGHRAAAAEQAASADHDSGDRGQAVGRVARDRG